MRNLSFFASLMLLAANIVLTIDHRLALMLYVLLLLAAAAPIAVGWLALLPHEREPFAATGEAPANKHRDAFAIFLLANLSLSLLLRFPGVERELRARSEIDRLFHDDADRVLMIVSIWFGFLPGLAAAYAALRANPIRLPLIAGGVLVLALWLAGPWLLSQIAANT